MHEFLCEQNLNHLTTGDTLPLHRFRANRPTCPNQRTSRFMPQLPEQLSSAIQHCDSGQWYQVSVGRQSSSSPDSVFQDNHRNIKDGSLEGTPQLIRIPQNTQTPISPLSLFTNSSATFPSLSLPTSSLGWDGTILLDLSCNFTGLL